MWDVDYIFIYIKSISFLFVVSYFCYIPYNLRRLATTGISNLQWNVFGSLLMQ